MESINSLKNRFVEAKKAAELRYNQGDYQGAMPYLQQAAELLGEIYRRDINQKNRELYVSIRDQITERFNHCKQELGLAPAPKKAAPRPAPVNKSAPGKTGSDKTMTVGDKQPEGEGKKTNGGIAEEDINYVVNGIDVKRFLVTESREKEVLFSDVVGMEREKRTVQRELFLSEEQKAFKASIGAKNKNFILLYGLPGTGKTYFAMALSNELRQFSGEDIPFFSVICTQVKSPHPGETENNIIAIFEFTKQFDRCVLFMDEFDAIGYSRQLATGDPTVGPAVNTLLTQLGGFASNPNLLFLAATNCPYNLDGALLSRASPKIEVPLPSAQVLQGTLERKLGKHLAPDVDLSAVAQRLEQSKFSNRDCSNLIEAIKDELIDAHEADDMIVSYDANMIKAALKKVTSSIKRDEEEKLEEFKAQYAE